jgi:hypothetical protein
MIDTIYTFLAGFLLGFGIMYYIAANLLGQTRKEIRYWRKQAIKVQNK